MSVISFTTRIKVLQEVYLVSSTDLELKALKTRDSADKWRSIYLNYRIYRYRVGQKPDCFLKVCNLRIC